MSKKAYRIQKDGDYYLIPAGYVNGRYHKEIRTMDKTHAEDVIAARKTLSLKQKYPEVRKGVEGVRQQHLDNPRQTNRVILSEQILKDIPEFISGGKYLLKLQGTPATKQVSESNENYYKHHGYKTAILKTNDGRYALYVSEVKG
jgi:hypothetical protein